MGGLPWKRIPRSALGGHGYGLPCLHRRRNRRKPTIRAPGPGLSSAQ
jgi:hypothetical protein